VSEVRAGDALTTLEDDLPEPIDLLFLDGEKSMYLDVLRLLEPRMRADALVVADNASRGEGYLDHMRGSGSYVSSDVGNDVEVSVRLTT